MKISYIRHALLRLKERGISRQEVEEAIIKGQERKIQPNGRIKCFYKSGEETIVVIYSQQKDVYKIITAYYLSYEN